MTLAINMLNNPLDTQMQNNNLKYPNVLHQVSQCRYFHLIFLLYW